MTMGLHLKVQDPKHLGPDGALWNECTLEWNVPGNLSVP